MLLLEYMCREAKSIRHSQPKTLCLCFCFTTNPTTNSDSEEFKFKLNNFSLCLWKEKMLSCYQFWNRNTLLIGVGLGQILSLLITVTAFTSSQLPKKGLPLLIFKTIIYSILLAYPVAETCFSITTFVFGYWSKSDYSHAVECLAFFSLYLLLLIRWCCCILNFMLPCSDYRNRN